MNNNRHKKCKWTFPITGTLLTDSAHSLRHHGKTKYIAAMIQCSIIHSSVANHSCISDIVIPEGKLHLYFECLTHPSKFWRGIKGFFLQWHHRYLSTYETHCVVSILSVAVLHQEIVNQFYPCLNFQAQPASVSYRHNIQSEVLLAKPIVCSGVLQKYCKWNYAGVAYTCTSNIILSNDFTEHMEWRTLIPEIWEERNQIPPPPPPFFP